MFEILIKSKPFADKFIFYEIKKIIDKDLIVIEKGLYQLNVKSEKELFEIVYELIYYSRLIENILLKVCEFKSLELVHLDNNNLDFSNKNLTFKVDSVYLKNIDHLDANKKLGHIILEHASNLLVDLSDPQIIFLPISTTKINYLTVDLVGFRVTKRDYKLNNNTNSINSIVPNYLFYLLELDKCEKNYIIIDPNSDLGDVIIESSLFNPRSALNVKNRHDFAIKSLFSQIPKIPKNIEDKNKYIAVVQNNKTFKHLKENINYSGQKIKTSQYEQDWLDVKFHGGDIDYIVSNFSHYHNRDDFEHFQKEFFYQAEFICKKKIGIISKKEINLDFLKKYKLEVKYFEEIFIGEQKYFIYVIIKRALLRKRIVKK